MNFLTQKIRNAALLGFTSALAFTASADATTSITEAQTEILALIGVAGAAMIAVALAGVGWSVGAKLIKRIGGKA